VGRASPTGKGGKRTCDKGPKKKGAGGLRKKVHRRFPVPVQGRSTFGLVPGSEED